MRSRVINNLQNKSYWWKTLLFIESKLTFKFYRRLYGAKHSLKEEKISSRILRKSLRGILATGLLAAVFIVLVELLSALAKDVRFTFGNEELGLLISTVVTVSGVFLGLYFTALSAIAGNLFMRAPQNLQNLFIRERKGGQYIKTLVLTMLIGVYYLLLRSFGYQVGFLGPILITLLCLYAIVRFMALGWQTFYFIHTQEASSALTGDAASAIDGATAGGFGWKKNYMQNHYRRNAKEALESLSDLVDFGIDPIKLSGAQLRDIVKFTGGLIAYYIEKKKQIPADSKWFATRYQHQNWLLTDESAITMALNTGTSLEPKDIRNQNWFEEQALEIIIKVFEHLVATKQWSQAQLCLETLVSVLEDLGPDFYHEVAGLITKRVGEVISKSIVDADNPKADEDKKGHIALMDSLGRLPIGSLVSLTRYVADRTCEDLVKEIDDIKWLHETSIYKSKLPGSILTNVEVTQKSYRTENKIEKKPVSPQWYIRTITTQQYLAGLKKYYDYIKSLQKDIYEDNVNELIRRHKYVQAAHLIDRWVEFTNKLLSLGWRVQQLIEQCEGQKKVQDLPWTSIDADTEKALLQSYDQKAIDKLAQLIMPLSLLPKTELKDLPDYFGQAYTFGVQAAYNAAKENNAERLKDLFPSVFGGALTAYQKTREDVEGWAEQSKIVLSSEPIEDLLTLSGFIKIYAELHGNQDLWKVCKDTWDSYLESASDAKATIQLMVAMMSYRDTQYGLMMPKAALRMNWDMQLRAVLEEKGFNVDILSSSSFDDTQPTHESPLIRVLVKYSGTLSFEARNVFFVTYLSKHSSATDLDIDFPDRRDFEQELNREMGVEDEEAE
ncbi:MAG: hypothetical protein JNK33_01030 [Candidatus Doudnabacteria bacterium]|nr:hypothetical protein [Candidatus Doudnabacteria bacterium]